MLTFLNNILNYFFIYNIVKCILIDIVNIYFSDIFFKYFYVGFLFNNMHAMYCMCILLALAISFCCIFYVSYFKHLLQRITFKFIFIIMWVLEFVFIFISFDLLLNIRNVRMYLCNYTDKFDVIWCALLDFFFYFFKTLLPSN